MRLMLFPNAGNITHKENVVQTFAMAFCEQYFLLAKGYGGN